MTSDRTVVAVLTAPGEDRPPGLEPVEQDADLRFASDLPSLRAALVDAEVLLVTDFRTGILREVWPDAHRVRWVHATSAGVDAMMFPELIRSEVPVTNARGIFDRPIAEYVLGLVLMFAKDFPETLNLQRRHCWQHRDSERIEGRSVLVVGAGSIGRAIARLVGAAGMRVEGVASRARTADPDFAAVHGGDDLHRALGQADYVVAATPLTPSTRGMFDAGAFRAMRPTARFINIGRGPLVKTADLVDALRAETIAGAALDVFEEEPLPADHPLWDMPRVIVSAHMAGDVLGWREALSEQFIENFHRWRAGEALRNVVDKQRGYVPRSQPEGSN